MGASSDQTYANLLRRAGEVVGGVDGLCRLLEVSAEDCQAWLSGRLMPPQKVLVRVVEILLAHVEGKPIPKKFSR